MKIQSSAFGQGQPIPPKYTCEGTNVNPPLSISGVPAGTASLALVIEDPDAPGKTFYHWLVWNMPADTDTINEGSVPLGAVQGRNSAGNPEYTGPCPPSGRHRYIFRLYALDDMLDLDAGAAYEDLQKAMEGHVLAETELIGTYKKKNP